MSFGFCFREDVRIVRNHHRCLRVPPMAVVQYTAAPCVDDAGAVDVDAMADDDGDDDENAVARRGGEREEDDEALSVSGGLSLMQLELSEEDQPAVVPYEEVRSRGGVADEGRGEGRQGCVRSFFGVSGLLRNFETSRVLLLSSGNGVVMWSA